MVYRVLVYGASSNPGGIESFLVNYIKKIDNTKYIFDFVNIQDKPLAYTDFITENGGKILNLRLPERKKHLFEYYRAINDFFKKNAKNYNCFWANLVDLAKIDILKYAKIYKIPKIIVHSHNSELMMPTDNLIGKEILLKHKINRLLIKRYATDFWACSVSAAQFFYPSNLLDKVTIINNAIKPDKMYFNKIKRNDFRKKFNLENCYVIGNVGRLQRQKNQIFALRILKELTYKSNKKIKLVFVGQGPDYDMLKQKVKQMGLKDQVVFTGAQKDMQACYSGFDCFLFPSLFEGLSVASLEAQANGLPMIINKEVLPTEAKINKNIYSLSLKDSADMWANSILEISKIDRREKNTSSIKKNFINHGFDIDYQVQALKKMLI